MNIYNAMAGRTISKVMLISLFIDELNIFAVPMMSILMEQSLHFGTAFLGMVTGATVGGTAFGSLLGGKLTDHFGRKKLFLVNLSLFLFSAIMSALSPDLAMLASFRFLAGIPAGSDIANVYCYITETQKPGNREIIGAYNTLMATLAILTLNIWVVIFLISGFSENFVWKSSFLIQLIPIIILFSLYRKLPESSMWKSVTGKTTYRRFLKKLWNNSSLKRTSLYSWSSGIASGIEVGTFAFFIPYIILKFGITGMIQDRLIIIAVYFIGIPAGYIGPKIIPKTGLRKLSYYGFMLSFASLIFSGLAIIFNVYIVLPATMMVFVWGNHWNNQPIIISQALVTNPESRGKAVGISNFVSQFPSFLSIIVFPIMFSIIGIGLSTIVVAMASLCGIIITFTVFREIYGYDGDLYKTPHGN
jgi:putative MFS transporter